MECVDHRNLPDRPPASTILNSLEKSQPLVGSSVGIRCELVHIGRETRQTPPGPRRISTPRLTEVERLRRKGLRFDDLDARISGLSRESREQARKLASRYSGSVSSSLAQVYNVFVSHRRLLSLRARFAFAASLGFGFARAAWRSCASAKRCLITWIS